jgi:23S rRNA pseudouridine1911/1915/1917 synthase
MSLQECLVYDQQESSERLDLHLTKYYPGYSRAYFQFLIDKGAVLLNGNPVKKRISLKAGDTLSITFLLPEELSLSPEKIPLDILYEDEEVIAINKQANLVIHPAPGSPNGTLVNGLLFHCKSLPDSETLRPGIVHRLDKDTTGVLIAAKTTRAHRSLVEQFSNRQVSKRYLAITTGVPKEGPCSHAIARHPVRRKEMAALADGKPARSDITVLDKTEQLAFVELDLKTGRTHQARVHLKYLKAPILGDLTYGSEPMARKWGVFRPLLHAKSLKLVHPTSGKPLELEAPIPEDMKIFIDRIQTLSLI